MIAYWNRQEVYMGYSISKCSDIRSLLANSNIEYTYKTINCTNSATSGSGCGVRGEFDKRIEFNYMYYIYVHKNDYDYACKLIRDLN